LFLDDLNAHHSIEILRCDHFTCRTEEAEDLRDQSWNR